jgi:ABC-type glycerol-3-phosphate transport system substrate-binding protein
MKIKIALLLLTMLAAGLALTGCASVENNSSQPSATHTHSH